MKTLRETCIEAGVSRRGLQWYEKSGLIYPSGHNERGHLLYDEDAIRRIKHIRLLQEFGFSVKEITDIIDLPAAELKKSLTKQLPKLEEKHSQMHETIGKIKKMIDSL